MLWGKKRENILSQIPCFFAPKVLPKNLNFHTRPKSHQIFANNMNERVL
jgi:hypothetical protein